MGETLFEGHRSRQSSELDSGSCWLNEVYARSHVQIRYLECEIARWA